MFYDVHAGVAECRTCSAPLRSNKGKIALVPRFGYACAAWDPPCWSGDPERIGITELVSTVDFVNRSGLTVFEAFGGLERLKATFCEGGTLFAANPGPAGLGFAICTNCGYADYERSIGEGRQALPPGFETHPRSGPTRHPADAGRMPPYRYSGIGPLERKPTQISCSLKLKR